MLWVMELWSTLDAEKFGKAAITSNTTDTMLENPSRNCIAKGIQNQAGIVKINWVLWKSSAAARGNSKESIFL